MFLNCLIFLDTRLFTFSHTDHKAVKSKGFVCLFICFLNLFSSDCMLGHFFFGILSFQKICFYFLESEIK